MMNLVKYSIWTYLMSYTFFPLITKNLLTLHLLNGCNKVTSLYRWQKKTLRIRKVDGGIISPLRDFIVLNITLLNLCFRTIPP